MTAADIRRAMADSAGLARFRWLAYGVEDLSPNQADEVAELAACALEAIDVLRGVVREAVWLLDHTGVMDSAESQQRRAAFLRAFFDTTEEK